MSNTKQLILSEEEARELYPNASPEFKVMLERSFGGKTFFCKNIMEIVISFEAACEYNNTNPLAKKFTKGTRNQIYQERVAEIIKALNQGWVANYNDPNEYKYAPYFYLNNPGFRFCGSLFVVSFACAAGGSRFVLKTRELADFVGKQFVKEYENWLLPDESDFETKKVTKRTIPPFTGSSMSDWEKFIMEQVKSFEDACDILGLDSDDEDYDDGTDDEISYKKGKVIVEALNGAYHTAVLDRSNTDQKKWCVWMEKEGAGFRFCASYYAVSFTLAAGGSRLYLCSEKLAKYFFEQFNEIMLPFWS